MRRWTAILFAMLLLPELACADAIGQGSTIKRYRIVPGQPNEADTLTLHLDIEGCIVVEPSLVAFGRAGKDVRIDIGVTDICDAQLPPRTQHYDLGSFPAGVYRLGYRLCSGNPPPQTDACFEDATETLAISAMPRPPVRVPALSAVALACLCVLMVLSSVAGRLHRSG